MSEAPTADRPAMPVIVDREAFEIELDALRAREKAHTREGDAIAAARRRLPAVEVDAHLELLGPDGPLSLLDAFDGRRQLIAYYFMWNPGRPAPEQCEGCTFYTSQVDELSYLHSRDITYAVFCQGRNVGVEGIDAGVAYEQSVRYRDFMGWQMPWYSAQPSLDRSWEDSPSGRPQHCSNVRTAVGEPDWPPLSEWPGGRPSAQWPRLRDGHCDDLGLSAEPQPDRPHHCH